MENCRAPPPSPTMVPQSISQSKCPGPASSCDRLYVDPHIGKLGLNAASFDSGKDSAPFLPPTPKQEAFPRRQALSPCTSPLPSPLHQIYSVNDENDAVAITNPIPPSPGCSDADTLVNETSVKRRFTLPSLFLQGKEKRKVSNDIQTSPHTPPGGSPETTSSINDADLCPSTVGKPGADATSTAARTKFQSTKAQSWPRRHRRPKTGGDEKDNLEAPSPKSEFSDSEDDNGCVSMGKRLGRRLSETFCFPGWKD